MSDIQREHRYGLNPNFNPEWSEDRIELLKKLWVEEKLSARECGLKLGVSRNAVIGKVGRLKLPTRTLTNVFKNARARDKNPIKVERRKLKRTPLPSSRAVRVEAIEVELPEPISKNIPFLERRMNFECSWIHGDTSTPVCCGHRVKVGSQFCPYHYKRVWVKSEKRVR